MYLDEEMRKMVKAFGTIWLVWQIFFNATGLATFVASIFGIWYYPHLSPFSWVVIIIVAYFITRMHYQDYKKKPGRG